MLIDNLKKCILRLKQFTEQEKETLANAFNLLPHDIQKEILELMEKNSLFLPFLCNYFFEKKNGAIDFDRFILDNKNYGEIR